MATVITVTGDEQVIARLRRIGLRGTDQRSALKPVADQTARRIGGIPVRTGQLNQSIRTLTVDHAGFQVGSSVRYARFVFDGTRHMAAQPPTVPTDTPRRAAQAILNSLMRP